MTEVHRSEICRNIEDNEWKSAIFMTSKHRKGTPFYLYYCGLTIL
jgi:hypothetical protein